MVCGIAARRIIPEPSTWPVMTRTALLSSILLTCSIVHADDLHDKSGHEQEYFHRIDLHMSRQEYEEISNSNRRFVLNNMRSYAENKLEMVGMPELGINMLGATLGLALDGSRLNLYKNKMLALKLKDVRNSDRSLYLEVNLDW